MTSSGESTPAASSDAPTARWHLSSGELLAILGFWTFIAILTAANRALDPRGPGMLASSSGAPIALAFTEAYLWALLTPLIFWMSSRYPLDRERRLERALALIALGIVISVFVDFSIDYVRIHVLHFGRPRPALASLWRGIRRLWFLNDYIVFVAVAATGFARDYFLRLRERQAEAARLHSHAARLEAQLAEARLDALRMQINPHFLFNTMHAISSMAERDPRGVRRMVAHLSELLRHTLEGAGEHEVTLEQELSFLRRYVEIMKMRLQGRLEFETDVEPGLLDAMVPNLLLQPIVENAFKHGVGALPEGGLIRLTARREGDWLLLTVWNSGQAPEPDAEREARGMGLRNTRARLAQLYGDAHRFTLSADGGSGVRAEIRLPYHTGVDLKTAGASPEEPE